MLRKATPRDRRIEGTAARGSDARPSRAAQALEANAQAGDLMLSDDESHALPQASDEFAPLSRVAAVGRVMRSRLG